MNKVSTFVFAFLLFLCSTIVHAQTTSSKGNTSVGMMPKNGSGFHTKWKTKPFDHHVFIENKGQFDEAVPGHDKVLYAAQLGSVWAFFTSHGVVYRYNEIINRKETTEKNEDRDKDKSAKQIIHYMNSVWDGAN